MAEKQYLIVENGCVKAKTRSGVVHRTYYSGKDAIRADWEEEGKSVVVQLNNGKVLVVNNSGVIIKRI
jgi:uncharacterized protein Veg